MFQCSLEAFTDQDFSDLTAEMDKFVKEEGSYLCYCFLVPGILLMVHHLLLGLGKPIFNVVFYILFAFSIMEGTEATVVCVMAYQEGKWANINTLMCLFIFAVQMANYNSFKQIRSLKRKSSKAE